MMRAQGYNDIAAVEMHTKVTGGLSCDNKRATLKFKDNRAEEVLIKGHNGGFINQPLKTWREIMFYNHIVDSKMRETVKVPNVYLGIADAAKGRQFLMIQFLHNHVVVHDLLSAARKGEDLEKLGGEGCSVKSIMLECADHIAAFHESHWQDRELLAKTKDYLMHGDWLNGENRE